MTTSPPRRRGRRPRIDAAIVAAARSEMASGASAASVGRKYGMSDRYAAQLAKDASRRPEAPVPTALALVALARHLHAELARLGVSLGST